MKSLFSILFGFLCMNGFTQEVIPPVPSHYFNDYAGVVSPAVADTLDKRLAQFERETSSQVVVAIYTNMQSDAPIKDYTQRVAQAWKVGQKDKNNGVTLFVFTKDRKMYLHVGYGLEKALPDEMCKSIIENKIVPCFKKKDFDGGLTAGVDAILDATKDQYKGTGETAGEKRSKDNVVPGPTNGTSSAFPTEN